MNVRRSSGIRHAALAACLSALLAACGGGGGSTPETPAPPTGGAQPPTAPINRAPSVGGSPPSTVTVGQAYAFTPTVSDPDGNSLAFSVTGKPAWLSFDTTTGALTGTPASTDVGASGVTITASDGSLQGSLSFTLTVVAIANRAPTLAGTGTASVTVGQAYAFAPTASDPDGDRLTFGISGKPAWATFDASTGRLSGTPASADVGASNVAISVSDGQAQASLVFTITVVAAVVPPAPPPANRAPAISGSGAATFTAGQAYAFTPTASDPDGNVLTFGIAGKPAWATFSTSTGRLAGTPGAGDVGASTFTISVSDGALSAATTFTITVLAANRAPTISGTPPASVTAGQAYAFTPVASDPDGDALTFSAAGRPSWLSVNASTGALTGTPTAADVGSSTVTLTASDGTLAAQLQVTVTVVQLSNGTATLSWTPPTTRTDGSALTNLAGYRIYYGPSASSLSTQVNVSSGLTSYVVTGLGSGTWYFAMSAVDANGVESPLTGVASKTIT